MVSWSKVQVVAGEHHGRRLFVFERLNARLTHLGIRNEQHQIAVAEYLEGVQYNIAELADLYFVEMPAAPVDEDDADEDVDD